jgi:hypothetical protein
MEPEECVEMMKTLRDAYSRVSGKEDFTLEQIYDLKHVLTEIEMCVISMRASIKKMEKKD